MVFLFYFFLHFGKNKIEILLDVDFRHFVGLSYFRSFIGVSKIIKNSFELVKMLHVEMRHFILDYMLHPIKKSVDPTYLKLYLICVGRDL